MEAIFCRQFEQWLFGRFTKWQCLASPPGFAKTNNPVEQFNKQIKRDHSLRGLASLNAQAGLMLDLAHHRSARSVQYQLNVHASSDLVRRYNVLNAAGRLALSPWYRGSIAFITQDVQSRVYRVHQSGVDKVRPKVKLNAILKEEADHKDKTLETEGQSSLGWMVDIDNNHCECRTWLKFAYCVHVIACRVHLDLSVDGFTRKRRFEVKRSTIQRRSVEGVVL